MKVIADAGGTKTEWCIIPSEGKKRVTVATGPINASVSTKEQIYESVASLKELMPELNDHDTPMRLFFYGAGCNSDTVAERVASVFRELFSGHRLEMHFFSDLEGAAKALFGNESGIACILGTGSASGLYNGNRIVDSVPSLGFILGDEGSGSFLGRQLLNCYFKRELSKKVKDELEEEFNLSVTEVIKRVYREGDANAYLASFVPFIKKHENDDEISRLIDSDLKLFFEKNVCKYRTDSSVLVGFVGGVASLFSDRLRNIAEEYGLKADRFLTKPIHALGEYYEQFRDD